MEVEDLKKLISEGESTEIEFKQSFHSFQEVARIISAFANTQGGLLFLGVTDAGEIKGVPEESDKIQQKISQSNKTISPEPLITIDVKEIDKKRVVVVAVHKADTSVFHTIEGAIFVRVGSTITRLEGNTVLEFLRNRQILLFEESVEQYARTDDIDKNKVARYLERRGQQGYLDNHSMKEFLLSKKLATVHPDFRLKSLAILFFAKEPQKFYPYTIIKLVRFDGTEPINVIAYEEAVGTLTEIIEHAVNFVKRFLTKEFKIEGLKREEVPFLPDDAIREAVINAVAHRDYFNKNETQLSIFDDRLEITNPGGLPEGMSLELLGKLSIQRNPGIYQLLKDYGYMEGIGSGISKILRLVSEAGLVKPEFIATKDFFRVIFRIKKEEILLEGLSKRQVKGIVYLRTNKKITSKLYSEINKVSIPTAVSDLKHMEKLGYIKKVGSYRGAYYILKEAVA